MKTQILTVLFFLPFFISCKKEKTVFENTPDGNYLHNRAVGASANELLGSSTYNSLKIEIQYMSGFAPDAAAMNQLQTVLNGIISKPSGITIVTKEIAVSSGTTLSIDEVRTIEEQNRTVFPTGTQLGIYVLYTNSNFTDNNVLGAAFRNTSVVIFGKTIHDNSGGIGQTSRTKLESTVLDHEFGHLLGLVDICSPMQTNHKDAAHGNHCNNTNCLMYYASDTRDVLGFLISGNVPPLDANCMADLHANGGK